MEPIEIGFDRISGSLRSLLLLWASIEDAVRREIAVANGSVPASIHGISTALRAWENLITSSAAPASLAVPLTAALRVKLQRPLEVRNGVCHGLIGISAAQDGVAATLRWRTNGRVDEIAWEDLQSMFTHLSKVPRAIDLISGRRGGPSTRLDDIQENRDWWSEEFGLQLPPGR